MNLNWLKAKLERTTPPAALVAKWIHELDTMQHGNASDWLCWSNGCQAQWARSMIWLAIKDGFYEQVRAESRGWLEQLAKETASRPTMDFSLTCGCPESNARYGGPTCQQEQEVVR